MDFNNENLEQLDVFNICSHGEKTSQVEKGVEQKLNSALGSKNEESEKEKFLTSTSTTSLNNKKADNFGFENVLKNNKGNEGGLQNSNEELVKNNSLDFGSGNKNLSTVNDEEVLKNSFSKFKSVSELSKAYDNLQSDYTRKCQMLANLQKQVEDNKVKTLPEEKDFVKNLNKFFEENTQAKDYKDEIVKLVLEDENLKTSLNPFESAWKEFKLKNFKTKRALSEDEDFLNNYIFNNDKIKEKIINEYFSGLTFTPSPKLILGNMSKAVTTPPAKPKSLSEASKLVEDIFN